MSYPYIMQGKNLVVVIDNKPHTISPSHLFYEKIIDAVKSGEWDSVRELVEPKQSIVAYSEGNIDIRDDTVYWRGTEMHNSMTTRMIAMLREGFDVAPLAAFMHNLMENPSNRAVNELYGFLEKNNLPITPDGHFLAYKKVRDDFLDVYSGTMDNSPGQIVKMERNQVDDDKNRTCSHGLHFCSIDYLQHFGGERIVIVKINPRDVVSIPSDYNDSKGRACQYEVLSELEVAPEEAFNKSVQDDCNKEYKTQEELDDEEFEEWWSRDDFEDDDYMDEEEEK